MKWCWISTVKVTLRSSQVAAVGVFDVHRHRNSISIKSWFRLIFPVVHTGTVGRRGDSAAVQTSCSGPTDGGLPRTAGLGRRWNGALTGTRLRRGGKRRDVSTTDVSHIAQGARRERRGRGLRGSASPDKGTTRTARTPSGGTDSAVGEPITLGASTFEPTATRVCGHRHGPPRRELHKPAGVDRHRWLTYSTGPLLRRRRTRFRGGLAGQGPRSARHLVGTPVHLMLSPRRDYDRRAAELIIPLTVRCVLVCGTDSCIPDAFADTATSCWRSQPSPHGPWLHRVSHRPLVVHGSSTASHMVYSTIRLVPSTLGVEYQRPGSRPACRRTGSAGAQQQGRRDPPRPP